MSITKNIGNKVPATIVARVASETSQRVDETPILLASLNREGVAGAVRRFPEIPAGTILLVARALIAREIIKSHDMEMLNFPACGLRWSLSPPMGLGGFHTAIHSRDVTALQLRVTFNVHDIAQGCGSVGYEESDLLARIRKDSVIRLNVCRAMHPIASHYLERTILQSVDIPHTMKAHAAALGRSIFSIQRLFPYLALQPRLLPNHNIGEYCVSVDATFSIAVELINPGRSEGASFFGVNVEDSGDQFLLASVEKAVKAIDDGGKHLNDKALLRTAQTIRTALNPMSRRRRRQDASDRGPQKSTRIETIDLGNPGDPSQLSNIQVVEIEPPEIVADLHEDIKTATNWWRSNRNLIKPTLGEIAATTIHDYGDKSVSLRDVQLLTDMALSSLGKVAKNRQPQFEGFGVDAAVAGLGALLQIEFRKRLR